MLRPEFKQSATMLVGLAGILGLMLGMAPLARSCAACGGFGVEIYTETHLEIEQQTLTRLSGIMIILVAIYLAILKIRAAADAARHRKKAVNTLFPLSTPLQSHCGCAACRPTSSGSDALLVISAGVVPCPGTVTIFLFAVSMELYMVGFVAAVAMSMGMGLVIFAVAAIGATSRNVLAGHWGDVVRGVEFASVGVILVLGVMLLIVNTGQ